MPLDEKSLRRPTFSPDSVPVVLADGQTWYLAKPTVCIRPSFRGGRVHTIDSKTSWGEQFDELVRAVDDGDVDVFNTVLSIGAWLLSRNYELADEQLEELFTIVVMDEDPVGELLSEIMRVARGQAPKQTPDGNA